MSEAKFILSKKVVLNQINVLEKQGLKVSYSYKTNHEVGDVLQKESNVDFSIHAKEEIDMISDKNKIWFFTQAELEEELKEILGKGIRNFVVDNEVDFERIMNVISREEIKINLSLRMKFQEHRIGTGRYFVYGMEARKINELILKARENDFVDKLGIHIHRKSQNTSEWEIKEELEDSISEESFKRINMINLGGGLPSIYRSYTAEVLPYIFSKINDVRVWLSEKGIELFIEPGRFIAASAVKLETEIIQVQGRNLIINTTIYNCALDTMIGQHKMLVQGELENEGGGAPLGVPQDVGHGGNYLIKGNSPTRDDIFRYNVKLESPRVGDKIIFLNAGAYNYTTDFFGYKKLKTEIVEDF